MARFGIPGGIPIGFGVTEVSILIGFHGFGGLKDSGFVGTCGCSDELAGFGGLGGFAGMVVAGMVGAENVAMLPCMLTLRLGCKCA